MTHKLWLRKLKLNYSDNILDIVQFGSSVLEKNKFNDIDIAVIYKKVSLKEQLDETQLLKKQLEKLLDYPIHMKSFDLYSFFEPGNFAKENILLFGKSIISGKAFAERFSFKPKLLISYKLYDLEKKDKVRFHYMLKGKGGKYGLLKKFKGKLLKPGLIQILPEHKLIFIRKIKEFTDNFNIRKILQIN